MKISLDYENEKISILEIIAVEKELEITFPQEYTDFLLDQNGGYPTKTIFTFFDQTNTSAISEFYPIGNMKTNLLKRNLFRECESFINIGDDQGGNQILLRVKGDNVGEVYFWYHDVDPEDENPMHFLANSFNEFLAMLK